METERPVRCCRPQEAAGFAWADDEDTTYAADESTVTLSADNKFSVKDSGVTSTQLGSGSVTAGKLSGAGGNGTSGQVLSSTGSGGFAWADDEDTTYTADESTVTLSADNKFSVKDSGVTSTQLGTDSVIEGKIQDGAVTGDKLGSGSVTAGKLSGVGGNGTSGQVLSSTGSGGFAWADDEDTTYTADESTVTLSADNKFSVKDSGVTSTQLGTDSVIEGKIQDGAVTGDKLGSGSVTAGKLSGVGGNGTSGQVLSSTGSGGFAWADDEDTTYAADESTVTLSADNKFSVKDSGVTSTQLGTDSVIEGKIQDGAVTGDKLGSGSVTAGKLSGAGGNGTSGQVLSSTGSGGFAWADDEDTTYTADESTVTLSADNKFSVKDLGVTSTQLGTDSVIEGKIQDGAVTGDKLGSGSVTAGKLSGAGGNGTSGQVLSSTGSGGFAWADDEDTTYTADESTVTLSADNKFSVKDLGVTSTQLGTDSVIEGKIQDGAVTGDKLGSGSVTAGKLSGVGGNGNSGQVLSANGTGGFAWADTYTADESTLTLSGGEFSIKNSGVTSTQLGSGAVTAGKLSGAGGNGTYGQVLSSTGSGGFAWADTYTADESTLTLSNGEFSVKGSGVTSTQLGTGSVIEEKIQDGAVTEDKLGSGAATSSKLGAGSVIAGKIGGGAVDGSTIGLNVDGKLYVPDGSVDAGTLDGHDSTYFAQASHTHPYWSLSGNTGTDPSADFWGTTDRVSLVLRVNNETALRVIPAAEGASYQIPNIVGGYSGNTMGADVYGAFIGGGGKENEINSVTANYGTVAGGYNNTAGGDTSFVGAGYNNSASGFRSFVGAGKQNSASGFRSFVGGGYKNTARGEESFIGGGNQNSTGGQSDVDPGGGHAFVGAGGKNSAIGENSVIGGGYENTAGGGLSFVGAGRNNIAGGENSAIGGGYENIAGGRYSFIGGGYNNSAGGENSAIGGGYENIAGGRYSFIGGGYNNSAGGDYSFAGGRRAKANVDGIFAWADSTNEDFIVSEPDRFAARASGGVYFYLTSDLSTYAYIDSSSGGWQTASDRNLKENIVEVNYVDVLRRLLSVSVSTWNYKTDEKKTPHMSPMAQDLYAAYGLGGDDTHISAVDGLGVSLAAILGVYFDAREKNAALTDALRDMKDLVDKQAQENKRQAEEIKTLEERLATLEKLIKP